MSEPINADAGLGRRGVMLVLSSPSGAGKSTIARTLIEQEGGAGLKLSISVTTRARRASEVEGVHYQFVDVERFHTMRQAGELLEWAEVHGNFYATPRKPVETHLAGGGDMVFDIDWQGAKQLRQSAAVDVVSVFILPPSADELRARLKRRAEDTDEAIRQRLENAKSEMTHWVEYDHVVVNRDLAAALEEVRSILHAEKTRRPRLTGMDRFVAGMIESL